MALAEMLIQEADPRTPIRGLRRVAVLSLLTGFDFAVLLSNVPHFGGEGQHGIPIAMAWRHLQPVRAMPGAWAPWRARSPQPTGHFPRQVVVHAETTDTNQFKNGLTIEMKGQPWKVVEFLHVKPGKGSAFVRSKLKNLITGNTNEVTFKAGEKVDLADMRTWTGMYSYMDGADVVLMDMETFDEVRLPADPSLTKFLKEGMEVKVKEWQGKPLDIDLPNPEVYEVTFTLPAVKGDTKSGGQLKDATIETGAEVKVPYFVDVGQKIMIDTSTGEFKGKADGKVR